MNQPYNYYPQSSYQPPINQPYPTLYRPQIPPGPQPVPFDPAAYSTHPHISTPRPHRHRRRETTPSAAAPPPLKSALKKTNTHIATPGPQPPIEFPLTRPRSNSFSQQPHGSLTRSRVYSNSAYPQNDSTYPSREEDFTPCSFSRLSSKKTFRLISLQCTCSYRFTATTNCIWRASQNWPSGSYDSRFGRDGQMG